MNIHHNRLTGKDSSRPIAGDYVGLAVCDFYVRRFLPAWLAGAGHSVLAAKLEALRRIAGHADVLCAFELLDRTATVLSVEDARRKDLAWRDACRGGLTYERATRMARRLAEVASGQTAPGDFFAAKEEVERREAEFLAGGWR